MARRRDIVVAAIIIVSMLFAMVIMAFVAIGMMSDSGDFDLAGLGGDVGVIELAGIIDEPNGRKVIRQLDRWTDNSSIKALVVHINSPGGGVAITQEIYDAMQRARDEKPVVAAMASVAASGGLYVACASDVVVANAGTLTGSIGVIMQFYTAEKLMDKIGVVMETVKSGELKDVGDFSRRMTDKEELMLRSVVMDSYEQFVEAVAIGRDMDKQRVRELADGAIYTGLQAYNMGLVDSLGGLYEAVLIAGDLAGIEGEPEIVRPYERREVGLFDLVGSVFGLTEGQLKVPLEGPQLQYLYK